MLCAVLWTVLCCAVLCCAVLWAVLCGAMSCTMLCCAVLWAVLWAVLCCAVLELGTKVAARVRKQKTLRTTDRLKGASASWGLSFVRIMRLGAFLGAFLKFQKATLRFVMFVCLSVRPHGTTVLPQDGFLWNVIYAYFPKTCRENSSFF